MNTNLISKKYNFNAKQILCVNEIINNCALLNVTKKEHIAYILATTKHETGNTFLPIKEVGSSQYFIRKYFLNSKVAKWLGNVTPQDAAKYCGRGYVQITGKAMYQKISKLLNVDLVSTPDLALDPSLSSKIAIIGMRDGLFTGVNLSKYDNADGSFNSVQARKIINSLDDAALISSYYNDIISLI